MIRQADGSVIEHVRPVYEALKPLDPSELASAVIDLIQDDASAGQVVDVLNQRA